MLGHFKNLQSKPKNKFKIWIKVDNSKKQYYRLKFSMTVYA